ncbi:MAG: hypothetical protein FJ150_01385 [Euryarchaeota archaeon]|nr:hypothetical protein [Euryarchaeota archaeon]
MASIIELKEKLNKLEKEDKKSFKIFNNIFYVSSSVGKLVIPASFKTNVREYFGERDKNGEIVESEEEVIKRLETQKIVKTFNKQTGEGALFNWLRASRPGMRVEEVENEKKRVYEYIEKSRENCDFCNPEKYTPEDVFGRVEGKHCITGGNIAKYDAWSSVIFFRIHNPLEFSLKELSDYIETGFKWFERVYQHDKEYKYPFFLWNCLDKAGASKVHGHAQILMTKEIHYAKVELLKRASENYRKNTGRDYFEDLYKAHEAIGLSLGSFFGDVHVLANLTPIKEKEIVIIARKIPSESEDVKKAIFNVLRCYIDELGVTSFNLIISCPPIPENKTSPYIVRIVDRGSIFKSTTDIGGMELYGSSVISDDPFKVIESLKEFLNP